MALIWLDYQVFSKDWLRRGLSAKTLAYAKQLYLEENARLVFVSHERHLPQRRYELLALAGRALQRDMSWADIQARVG